MYRNFFSLNELPFSIAPDPKYLFMSERHKEALSHLTYGQGEIGGFALLTGEVGTGKTTVSRCLMEELPDNTQAAFILNPMLSSEELLATLCDKLDIDYQKNDITLKNLTDKISEKLLDNHKKSINTLLIIDEAQHLQPEVLEQLRLLTNLETNTKKLLQVILIGQPELQQLLQRRDLRQLAQRITARYHLMPLTKEELKQYIQHRLMIAGCARSLFDKGAIAKIHQISEGVPRLINLLCHSALMSAYNHNDSVVDKKAIEAAAESVLGTNTTRQHAVFTRKNTLVLSTIISVTAFIALASFWWGQRYDQPQKNTQQLFTDNVEVNSTLKPQVESKNVDVLLSDLSPTVKKDLSEPALLANAEDVSAQLNVATAESPILVKDSVNLLNDKPILSVAYHTVNYGDSLYSISLKYNTKIKALLEWNHITEDSDLTIGDKLHVMSPAESDVLVISGEKHSPIANKNSQNKPDDNYEIKNVDGVSADLLARFKMAIDATEIDSTEVSPSRRNSNVDSNSSADNDSEFIKKISDLTPNQQNALPKMQFEQHIYASDGEGWVTVNGRDRYEGDYISEDVLVDKILPQTVILSFKGEKFSMPALTNW